MFFYKRFKLLSILMVTLCLLVTVIGCSQPSSSPSSPGEEGTGEEKILIRIAINTPITHPEGINIEEFKRRLEEKVGDRVKVELYPSQQLGTAVKMLEGVQAGTIQIHHVPLAFLGSVAPAAQIIDLPFFFDSNVQAYELLNFTDASASLNQYLEDRGFLPFGYFIMDYRTILSTFPIDSKDALKGKKIRTLASEVAQSEIEAFGGVGVPVETGEVYTALQQGMVDGISSDVLFFVSNKLYEVARYHNTMNHGVFMCCLVASKSWFESQPADIQEAIRETVDELLPWSYDRITTLAKENMEFLKEEGLTIVETPPEVLQEFKDASIGVHERFLSKESDEVRLIYEDLKEAIEKNK